MPNSSIFGIAVDGKTLPPDVEALLASAYVDDNLHLPDCFLLRFRDSERMVLSKGGIKIGSALTISVTGPTSTQAVDLITAEVTAVEAEFSPTGTFTLVRGYDPAHRLFRGRRTETYLQMTASDIARKVAQRAGLQIGSIQSTSTVYDHVSQAGTTDWEFLDRLAREIGCEIAVVKGRFTFRSPRPSADAPAASQQPAEQPLVLEQGTDLLRFRAVVTSAEQVKEVQVRGWDVSQKKALVATSPAKTTSATLGTTDPARLAKTFGDPTYVSGDVPYGTQAEVASAAEALAEHIASSFAEFQGVARGNPALFAGAAISIDRVGAPFDGKYTITTSRHSFDPSTGYTTTFAVTGRSKRSLLGLTGGGGPVRTSPGVMVGQVSDSKDPQDSGRVRVKLPTLNDDYVSDWARTVFAGAGKDRGMVAVPEVGDEVLVAFEQGDMRRPFVLGGLFNGVDTPPTGDPALIDSGSGAVNRRSWVSRRGHRIDLKDQDGQTEGITLSTTQDKLKLTMDHTGTKVTVHSDGTVLVEGGGGITVDAGSSKLELKGGDISMKATSGVTIDGGSGAVQVSTSGQLNLKGTAATLEGSAQTTVKAGAMCTVQAAMVKIN
ncbi:VgrG-related protein [Angustibacter sp. McL0619]|uniref:VgrG-related protein n=1 Tax=Angustibacter sp. McL0619 TaxID=3415676 RepID=UPI003CF31A9D